MEKPKIHCPAVPKSMELPFAYEEIEPLLSYLGGNEPTETGSTFPRGTVTAGQTLDCCKQDLGPAGAYLLTEVLKKNTHINAILFGTGAIGDLGAAFVADLLKENETIETVYLGCNLITAEGTQVMMEALKENPQVKALWLKRNPVGAQGVRAIVDALAHCKQIRTLDLVHTAIGAEGLAYLVEGLIDLDYPLERLYLGGNQIDEKQAPYLRDLLAKQTHIQELYLAVNGLADRGAIILSEGLAENQSLHKLSLASNGIEAAGVQAVLHAAAKHPKLYALDFGLSPSTRVLGAKANCLGQNGAKHVAAFLQQNTPLLSLNLKRTQLTKRGLYAIKDALLHNDRLIELRYDRTRDVALRAAIREKLVANQAHAELPAVHKDVQAIRSVYR